jgi:secondary thiamine-phosphate synthase enzyme
MEMVVPTSICHHTTLRVPTSGATEFIDLTRYVEGLVADARIRVGLVNVQTRHTTTAIVLNEAEPLLYADFTATLERAAPHDAGYRHDDASVRSVNVTVDERVNGHAHCRALFVGSSVCLNVAEGRLQLGRWQRVLLAELDGPREREVSIMMLGEAGR